jgi:hypothetical protein
MKALTTFRLISVLGMAALLLLTTAAVALADDRPAVITETAEAEEGEIVIAPAPETEGAASESQPLDRDEEIPPAIETVDAADSDDRVISPAPGSDATIGIEDPAGFDWQPVLLTTLGLAGLALIALGGRRLTAARRTEPLSS